MRKRLMFSVAAAAVTMGAAAIVHAGTYIPVPMVPGAVSEIAFSINNSNIVAGSFRDSANVEHGFFGSLDGSNWTTFDAPFEGTTGTEARSINEDGAIVGIAMNPSFTVGEEFYRSADGTFSAIEKDGVPLDGIAQGIDRKNRNLGDYVSSSGQRLGYIGQNGQYSEDFRLHIKDHKKFQQIAARGKTNRNGAVVGYFVDAEKGQLGFVQIKPKGKSPVATIIDYTNHPAISTALEDTNDSLLVTGQWVDTGSNPHAFTLQLGQGRFIIQDLDPGDKSKYQQAWGVNEDGLVAISTSKGRSYIYCPKDKPKKCPGGFTSTGRDQASAPVSMLKHRSERFSPALLAHGVIQ